ncbi:hypothetical protein Ddye_021529 [Dipteronia dyeriana]|uniref:Uncharacterized protein n=1 Tax=Dipteronia dyeriana TaxID=168575 RepID=A0AAD9WWE6_9ROSI|nr:hypothetical protein Ddye_021529 [Dipteronia dyeriana]
MWFHEGNFGEPDGFMDGEFTTRGLANPFNEKPDGFAVVASARCLPDGISVLALMERTEKWSDVLDRRYSCEEDTEAIFSIPSLFGLFSVKAVENGKYSAGLVVREDNGLVVAAIALVFNGLVSVEVAEAKAIYERISRAVGNG